MSECIILSAGTDISDADAAVGDVKDPKTFYSVEEPKKTGTMPTVAIAPGSSAYPAGYHAGDGGGLPAVDTDLVTGSIKSGVTIFNVAGHTDVRDVSDADAVVGEVKSTKTFYAVGGARKTGTMPTVAIVAGSDTYSAGYHAGDAGGLDAIDTDLAPANIKKDVIIFGKVGTVTPVEDVVGAELTTILTNDSVGGGIRIDLGQVPGDGNRTLATENQTFDSLSMAVGFAYCYARCHADAVNHFKLDLVMGGVQVAQSAWLTTTVAPYLLVATKALSGSQNVVARMTSDIGSDEYMYSGWSESSLVKAPYAVAVGSVKI